MKKSLLKSLPIDLLEENCKKRQHKKRLKKEKLKKKISVFILGLINNTTYIVILSASKKLYEKFSKTNFIPFSRAL